MNFILFAIVSLLVIKAPSITSLWPAKNLVAECITISAPISSGLCKYGDAKVLSTANKILCSFVNDAIFLISIILIIGFVGVSTQINLVFLFMCFLTFSILSNDIK